MTKVAHAIRGEEFDVPEIGGVVSEQAAGVAPARGEETVPVHGQEPVRAQEPVRVQEQTAGRAANDPQIAAINTSPVLKHAPRRPAPAVSKPLPAVDGS
ncbi:MAG: hypothetical protein ACYSU7_14790 [Planctomycetota bacterium]|jgi:hypothetical protein